MAFRRLAIFVAISAAAGAAAARLHWGGGASRAAQTLQKSTRASSRPGPTAEEILRAFKKVKTPAMSSGSDPEALEKFQKELEVGLGKRNALALELATRFPNHPKAADFMWIRWCNKTNFSHATAEVVRETEESIAKSPSPRMRDTARAARAMTGLQIPGIDAAKRTVWVLDAADAKDVAVEVVPDLLESLAIQFDVEPASQKRLLEKAA